jgi:hypothetical protein
MTKVYCRTTDKGQQTFYVLHENRTYYLFSQDYRVSNKTYFRNGLFVSEVYDFSRTNSFCVRKTLEKIQRMLPYLEQEYDIVLTRRKQKSLLRN